MRAAGVDAIVVLGGDGTSRVVARSCGEIALCPLSTGTNNAFPSIREATVAGIATGLVVGGRVEPARRAPA
jgi:predicted polyphosphate/ATP-dependent NAD kinase